MLNCVAEGQLVEKSFVRLLYSIRDRYQAGPEGPTSIQQREVPEVMSAPSQSMLFTDHGSALPTMRIVEPAVEDGTTQWFINLVNGNLKL